MTCEQYTTLHKVPHCQDMTLEYKLWGTAEHHLITMIASGTDIQCKAGCLTLELSIVVLAPMESFDIVLQQADCKAG